MAGNDVVTVEVKGLDELQRALEELPDKDGTKYVRAALRAGGKVVKDEIAQRAPRETGFTSEHVSVSTRKQKGEALAMTAFVGPNNKEVRPKDEEERTGKKKGKTGAMRRTAAWIARQLEFGSKGRKPFMTSAWEGSKEKALEAITDKIKEKLFG